MIVDTTRTSTARCSSKPSRSGSSRVVVACRAWDWSIDGRFLSLVRGKMRGSSWRGIWVGGVAPRRFGGGWGTMRRLAFATPEEADYRQVMEGLSRCIAIPSCSCNPVMSNAYQLLINLICRLGGNHTAVRSSAHSLVAIQSQASALHGKQPIGTPKSYLDTNAIRSYVPRVHGILYDDFIAGSTASAKKRGVPLIRGLRPSAVFPIHLIGALRGRRRSAMDGWRWRGKERKGLTRQNDITATHKLALDVHLRDRRPL